MNKVTNHRLLKRVSALFLVFLLTLGTLITFSSSNSAQAVVNEFDPLNGYWEPLQKPEPVNKNDFSYEKICALSDPNYNNGQDDNNTGFAENTWYYGIRDICNLAAGSAAIHHVFDAAQEAQGIFSFEALFNAEGIVNTELTTSNPMFHVLWGKNWDLKDLTVVPLDNKMDSLHLDRSYPISSCRTGSADRGECGFSQINVGDGEEISWPRYHDIGNVRCSPKSQNWVNFLNDSQDQNNSCGEPEFWSVYKYENHFPAGQPFADVTNKSALIDKIGGDFNIQYINRATIRDKKVRIRFTIQRKPFVPENEKPFVGAFYKSYDKTRMWQAGQFLGGKTPAENFYELLKVKENQVIDSSLNPPANTIIPAHILGIKHVADDTEYLKESAQQYTSDTCQPDTPYYKKFRYKSFGKPDKDNPFEIVSLTDPKTGAVVNLEKHIDKTLPLNPKIWWTGYYRGYNVRIDADQSFKYKDGNGVSNIEIKWTPTNRADITPDVEDIRKVTVTLNNWQNGALILPANYTPPATRPDVTNYYVNTLNPDQALPKIQLANGSGGSLGKDYLATVRVTKLDGDNVQDRRPAQPEWYKDYQAKTKNVTNPSTGKTETILVAADGSPLKTDTSMTGYYKVSVIKLFKTDGTEVNTPCITFDTTKDFYKVFPPNDAYMEVQKVDSSNRSLQGAEFKVYPDKAGQPDLAATPITFKTPDGQPEQNGKPTNGIWISTAPVKIGNAYWLVETKAPLAHELALPVKFTLTADGITLAAKQNDETTVKTTENLATAITDTTLKSKVGEKVSESYVFQFKDVKAGKLPASGGHGWLAATILGLALMGSAIVLVIPRKQKFPTSLRKK